MGMEEQQKKKRQKTQTGEQKKTEHKQSEQKQSRSTFIHGLAKLVSYFAKFKKTVLDMAALVKTKWNNNNPETKGSTFFPFVYFIGSAIYLEVLFHILIYRSIDAKVIYPVLFAIPFGIMLTVFTGLFSGKAGKVIYFVMISLTCLIFEVQLVYFYVFKVYFSLQSLGLAEDAFSNFYTDVLKAIGANVGGIVVLLIPIVVLAVIMKGRIVFQRRGMRHQCLLLGSFAGFHLLAVLALLVFGRADYSPYDLYFHSKVPNLSGEQLGVVTMTRLDIGGLLDNTSSLVLADTEGMSEEVMNTDTMDLAPTSIPVPTAVPTLAPENTVPGVTTTPVPTQPPTPTPIDTSPNIMNIDFNALAEQEKSKTIKTLDQYFASVTPTNKNEYTGMFKGYNLIMLTAEGFSPYAVNPEKTPTLYKLIHEGFVFNNFYTALWQTSTSDGEYVAMTGLIPIGTRSMYRGRENLWPFSLGRQFDQLGVPSRAYHDHTYTYYQRNETHPNLGYLYKGKGNGLELPTDSWPESDLEMMEATAGEYIGEEQFHTYYMTVSGHMNYTFVGNSMSYKNKALVEDLPYSADGKAYIACQIELDRALEYLIKALEEAGVADRTVIALSADHYPYGWEKDKLDELAGHEVDPSFEIYRNHFILWSEGMKENVIIDEPCSSLDILPTLSNLFGLEYDSRLLMGQDILSDAPPLVVLSNRSFITDKVMYNSADGESTLLTDEPLPENYISNLNKIVKNKFSVSQSILDEDYYRHVFPDEKTK